MVSASPGLFAVDLQVLRPGRGMDGYDGYGESGRLGLGSEGVARALGSLEKQCLPISKKPRNRIHAVASLTLSSSALYDVARV